jgi:hypothetical protein
MEANQLGHRACAARTRLTEVLSALSKLVFFHVTTHGNGVGDGVVGGLRTTGVVGVLLGKREVVGEEENIRQWPPHEQTASAFNALHRNIYAKEGGRRQPTRRPLTTHTPNPPHPSFTY